MMGVGKSSLVKQTLLRVKDRKIFIGGMIFVDVKSMTSVDTLVDVTLQSLVKGIKCEKTRKEF